MTSSQQFANYGVIMIAAFAIKANVNEYLMLAASMVYFLMAFILIRNGE